MDGDGNITSYGGSKQFVMRKKCGIDSNCDWNSTTGTYNAQDDPFDNR